jgi:hypothetical protein
MHVAAAKLPDADTVAWVCLVVGLVTLLSGVVLGMWIGLRRVPQRAGAKIDQAKQKLETAHQNMALASQSIGAGDAASGDASKAASTASASTQEAKSALEEVAGIVGSLPENLRFAGMLVLVGTVLIGVATTEFGGTSIF